MMERSTSSEMGTFLVWHAENFFATLYIGASDDDSAIETARAQ